VWVLNPDRLSALNNNMLGDCTYGIEMPKERSIDIDTEFDFFIGECIAQRLWHRKRTAASQHVKAKRPK
jgi:CMP-N-acetylneuraminic acid synthetase